MSVFNQSRSNIIRLIFSWGLSHYYYCNYLICRLFRVIIASSAMNNAVFRKVVYPNRGIIYDRKGKAILNNTIMYDLVVTPNEVKNIDTASLV